jgi:hypothetical protein
MATLEWFLWTVGLSCLIGSLWTSPISYDLLITWFVSILASFCVWTKSLICKDAVTRDSTCQSIFRRLCTAKKVEDFRFPISRPDDVLSRPDVHLSIALSVRTTCHPVRTPNRPASSDQTTYLSIRTPHCIEKHLFQLAFVQTSQQPIRTSISDRSASNSFQVQIWEDWYTVRTTWFPVRTHSYIRQESQFKYHRPDVSQPWSGRACN